MNQKTYGWKPFFTVFFTVGAVCLAALAYWYTTETAKLNSEPAPPSAPLPTKREDPSAPPTPGAVLIGTGPTGYELWRDENCIHVRGLSVRDFGRLGVTVDQLKKVIEQQTGFSCVLYELPFRP